MIIICYISYVILKIHFTITSISRTHGFVPLEQSKFPADKGLRALSIPDQSKRPPVLLSAILLVYLINPNVESLTEGPPVLLPAIPAAQPTQLLIPNIKKSSIQL